MPRFCSNAVQQNLFRTIILIILFVKVAANSRYSAEECALTEKKKTLHVPLGEYKEIDAYTLFTLKIYSLY